MRERVSIPPHAPLVLLSPKGPVHDSPWSPSPAANSDRETLYKTSLSPRRGPYPALRAHARRTRSCKVTHGLQSLGREEAMSVGEGGRGGEEEEASGRWLLEEEEEETETMTWRPCVCVCVCVWWEHTNGARAESNVTGSIRRANYPSRCRGKGGAWHRPRLLVPL